jgi:hypothetical protein
MTQVWTATECTRQTIKNQQVKRHPRDYHRHVNTSETLQTPSCHSSTFQGHLQNNRSHVCYWLDWNRTVIFLVRWEGHAERTGEMRNAYRIFVGKGERRKTLGRCRHRWEDNIRMNFREIGWEGGDWTHHPLDKNQWRTLVDALMKVRVPKTEGNLWIAEWQLGLKDSVPWSLSVN